MHLNVKLNKNTLPINVSHSSGTTSIYVPVLLIQHDNVILYTNVTVNCREVTFSTSLSSPLSLYPVQPRYHGNPAAMPFIWGIPPAHTDLPRAPSPPSSKGPEAPLQGAPRRHPHRYSLLLIPHPITRE